MFPTTRVRESLRFKQIRFTLPELYICIFALINIRKQDIPADNTTFLILQWEPAYVEPAVNSVRTKNAVLDVVRKPGLYRATPLRYNERTIFLMQERAPIFQLLKGLARVIQDLLINSLDLTRRGHRTNHAWNAIDDQAKTLFARAEGIL